MKERLKAPELRFPGFTDDWEERKLGQYTKLITKGTTPKDKTGIGDVNFVKVENITSGKIYPINKIKQNEHDNYLKRSRLEEKDILFSIAGTLGRTAIVNKSILPANTNQALAIIRGYDFDTNFLITSLAGNVVKEYIRRNPTVGAQPNLSLEQVGNLLVNTPNAEEQQKIGSFFKQLDDTIDLHQRKLDLLKEQKKGYLQKMFPKNGAKVPELRFAGFADDWEERKLGEVIDIENGYAFKSEYFSDEEKRHIVLTPGSVKIGGGFQKDKGRYYDVSGVFPEKFIFKPGNIFITMTDLTPTAQSLGYPAIVPRDDNVYLHNQRLGKIINTTTNPEFLYTLLTTDTYHKEIVSSASGTTVKHSSVSKILDFKSAIPNIDEQKLIGSFFKELDNTIALHQHKLDLLKEQKKSYLQKMFI